MTVHGMALGIVGAFIGMSAASAQDAIVWQRWEASLTSATTYANPFRDVTVNVTFSGPNGESVATHGFWDGGETFRIRAAFPASGRWTWRTTCSDTANDGLHGRSGTVRVSDYTGDNPLYKHGYLRPSANRRYLVHADGTPFFYLADTAWIAPLRASQADWQTYIDDRARKGFSAVQVAPASRWGGDRNVDGDLPFTTVNGKSASGSGLELWNPAYWQHYERMVEYANQQGIMFFMNGVAGPVNGMGGTKPGAAEAFARNIAGRLAGNHVIFAPNFDTNPWAVNKVDEFQAIGRVLQDAGPALVATHPNTSYEPVQKSHALAWLDISGVQSGHNGGNRERVFDRAREWVHRAYELDPVKPMINLEAFYDAENANNSQPKYQGNAKDARATAYLSVLNGSAGYGYGAYGIWNWEPDAAKPYHWKKAMSYASSDQMGFLRRFFESVDWHTLEPRPQAIRNQPGNDVADFQQKTMAFAVDAQGRRGVAYLPAGGRIELDVSVFSGPVNARWFDPVGDKWHDVAGAVANTGAHTFAPPQALSDDAVLVLERRSAP